MCVYVSEWNECVCVCVSIFARFAIFTLCTEQCQKYSVHHYLDKRMQETTGEKARFTISIKDNGKQTKIERVKLT